MKVLIIGGGAAGMAAAIEAARNGNAVTLLERQSRVGRKLAATGNGRCNLTNENAAAAHYHGDPALAAAVLRRFSVEDTLHWFSGLGLYTVREPDGKYYPLSDRAACVVDTLRLAMSRLGVTVVCGCQIESVKKKACGWQASAADGTTYFGDRMIITCGGCAGTALGGTKSGYQLLASLGHSRTALYPVLVQLKTDTEPVRPLKGIRADAGLTLKDVRGILARSAGEVQFTEFGVSGPAVFEISRAVSIGDTPVTLLLDLLRSRTEEALLTDLRHRLAAFPGLTAEMLLTGMLHPRLAQAVLKAADAAADAVPEDEGLRRIVHTLKFFPLTVLGTLGMEHAQVTAGGISAGEFRQDTLESRLAPGVFAAGEVLDVDGDCGGYNLQWAWSSGRLAGRLGQRGDDR